MWDDPITYLVLAVGLITAVLTRGYWGSWVYALSRNWKLLGFVTILSLVGILAVMMQQDLKYKLAYSYWRGNVTQDSKQIAYQIRQCKEFVLAKANGKETSEYHQISAGPVNISKISNYDFCARTFGLNFWHHDITINGQDGGRLLCETYARDTYRSSKVQSWCDTVFAPRTDTSAPKDHDTPAGDRDA